MKFDFVSFLGGLTAGAAAAAVISLAGTQKLLGQGVVAGGPMGGFGGFSGLSYSPGGGSSYAPGGGSGVVVGPGQGALSTSFGPSVVEQGPVEEGDVLGPVVSVPPIVHDGNGVFGDSFFGVNVAPWFWPLNVFPIYQWPLVPPPPQSMVCKKIKDDEGEETFVCDRRYPVQSVAWGPPAGWL
jgi:hypothetical protein